MARYLVVNVSEFQTINPKFLPINYNVTIIIPTMVHYNQANFHIVNLEHVSDC